MADFDVIVVGGGGAGIAAAIEALDAGARVLLCEKADRIGGSAANSGGVIMAAGTDIQRERGVEDSVDDLYEHYMTHSKYLVEPQLARILCEGGQEVLDWLRSHGVTFDPANLYVAGVENPKAPRGHPADGNGLGIMTALEGAAMSRGLEAVTRTRVQSLLQHDDGTVYGIVADNIEITADAVVIASGGFGNNLELLERYYPEAARHGKDWHYYVGIRENVGDGLVMGVDPGAAIVGEGFGNANVHAQFSKEPEPYLPGWLVYINENGCRFMDETAPYVVADTMVHQQSGGRCWAIMDHPAFTRDPKDPKYKSAEFLIFPKPNWEPEALQRHLQDGLVVMGQTIQELGEKLGIAAEAMAATVEEYNRNSESGVDPHFRKVPSYLLPLENPPFYAIELRAAGVGTTHAGLRIDSETRVYNTQGRPISGLFAAGECTGGVMSYYVMGGASMCNNFVFGRIAGRNAAAVAKARQALAVA